VCSVCTLPLMLPVHQSPLAAYLRHQVPIAMCKVLSLSSGRTQILTLAINLTAKRTG